ncbi:vacuolar protein sorting 53 [Guillardia theta CCMP2712]|nr:vacuolar protein sorting 53 [Guillardia theta CCMP2712]EKX52319.1 vacuolar protein sorting 53 [Guillardia theta CCMP2712]|eukprot:XP_005839299.1 vacuolar protein sorting 53 [Guillardia theta CCMP2712]
MSKEFPELRRGESEQLIDQAIADVLPSEDPFESPNFDVIAMLNKHFPNELSLTSIETTCDRLAVKMNELDISILHAVELQSSEGEAAKQDLERANRSVSELMANLKSIKERGEATKSMVHEICRDIQTLDFAKQNLTTTIIALRRLNMLENAIEQLSEMTAARAYKEAANLLEAMTQLAANFDAFKNVPKVCELLASVRALRSQLQAQVLEEFKLHINVTMPEDVSCMLKDAAQVVCVLGQGLILKLVKWFSDKELGEYENLFDPSKHPAGLESVEKRFAWLRRWLRSFSFSYGEVMPSSWEVPRVVSEEFCHRTRNHLAQLLQKKSKEMDVRLLMHVIQKTIEFEQELSGRFFVAGVEAEAEGKAGEGEGASNEGRMKFAVNCGSENRRSAFDRIISRVFKPYMSLFLKLERAHMADLVKSLLSKEDWGAGLDNETEEEEAPVLSSTGELFLYIKRSLNQCSAVDTGETLLHLSRAFEETLIQYAQGLHKHIAEKAR